MLSVDAVQVRFIDEALLEVAIKFVGTDGATISGHTGGHEGGGAIERGNIAHLGLSFKTAAGRILVFTKSQAAPPPGSFATIDVAAINMIS